MLKSVELAVDLAALDQHTISRMDPIMIFAAGQAFCILAYRVLFYFVFVCCFVAIGAKEI